MTDPSPAGAAVTVVIPTYERVDLLRASVQSVLTQTRGDLRLLITDNASTDGTADYLASLTDPRVDVVRHPRNLGMSANINGGLTAVTTPFAALLLDDDLWAPQFLERALPWLEQEPGTVLVHTAFRTVDAAGEVLSPYVDWHEGEPATTGRRPGRELVRDLLLRDDPVMVSAAVMRTEALPTSLFAAEDVPADDLGAYLRMGLLGDVAFVAEPLAAFRQHGGSATVEAGTLVEGATYPDHAQLAVREAVKLRFLAECGEAFEDLEDLRCAVRARSRQDALATLWAQTLGQGPVATAIVVRGATQHVPGLWREVGTWRLLAGRSRDVLGRSAVRSRDALERSVLARQGRQHPTKGDDAG